MNAVVVMKKEGSSSRATGERSRIVTSVMVANGGCWRETLSDRIDYGKRI